MTDKTNNEELKYPISFVIKIIMQIENTEAKALDILNSIFNEFSIDKDPWKTKRKEASKYAVFSSKTTIKTKEQMENLYNKLKDEPLVKMAL